MQSSTKTLLVVVGVVVALFVLAIFAKMYGSKNTYTSSSEMSTTSSTLDTSAWLTFDDPVRGIYFKYPKDFSNNYISAFDWPPRVTLIDGPFACTEAGTPVTRAGQTKRQAINGEMYCVTIVTEGAAGSIYNQYAYAVERAGKVTTLNFSTREPQCANYSESEKTTCEVAQASFDLNTFVGAIVKTLQLSPPSSSFDYKG